MECVRMWHLRRLEDLPHAFGEMPVADEAQRRSLLTKRPSTIERAQELAILVADDLTRRSGTELALEVVEEVEPVRGALVEAEVRVGAQGDQLALPVALGVVLPAVGREDVEHDHATRYPRAGRPKSADGEGL